MVLQINYNSINYIKKIYIFESSKIHVETVVLLKKNNISIVYDE